MTKAGSYTCKLSLKTTEEDEEQEKKRPQAKAGATESSVDAAVAVVLSELHDTTALKEKQHGTQGFFTGNLYRSIPVWL